MPHLEEFFTHGNGNDFCAGSKALKDVQSSHRRIDRVKDSGVLYLHGPQDAGQTSLLLQFGFTQVQAGKNVVLVMCGNAGLSQDSMVSEVVPLTPCSTCHQPMQTGENNGIWRRIAIKYFRNSTELQHFLCSLHVVDKQTSVVLVDGFERFFIDDSRMGNVYQTLAYLLETRDYMKKTTGSGVVVVTGNSNVFLLQNRPLLRRWCRFVELAPVVEEPNVFTMREEVEDDVDADVARTQVQYEFAPRISGIFQLLHVQQCGE